VNNLDKPTLISIVHELKSAGQLPASFHADVSKLGRMLAYSSSNELETATDGVVTVPAGQQTASEENPGTLVNQLYSQLDEYLRNHRAEDRSAKLTSVLHRLRGQVDAYERDFP
jgi:hypothetical protein